MTILAKAMRPERVSQKVKPLAPCLLDAYREISCERFVYIQTSRLIARFGLPRMRQQMPQIRHGPSMDKIKRSAIAIHGGSR
jgi:hypothetical protein